MRLREALETLKRNGKATFAVNLQNFYQIEAAMQVSIKLRTPVIVQFSERFLRFLDTKYGIRYILERYRHENTFFHLDHCIDKDFIKYCVDSGFDSVMFDGSAMELKDNIRHTLEIMEYAGNKDCLVEGELGKVSGVEDGFGDHGSSYAELEEVRRFIAETKVDLLALGIGNAHGFYSSLDGIKMDILKEASEELSPDQLFVLHGGSGLPEEYLREAIGYGVVKINLSTEIKKRTQELLRLYAKENEIFNEISFHNHMVNGIEEVISEYLNQYTI